MKDISIGDQDYKVYLAKTEEEMSSGLQDVSELSEDHGMLFCFDKPDTVSMWMDRTFIPLDIIFIDEDYNVIKVQQGVPESKELITCDNTLYVLEVNAGSGIKIGDELELDNEEDDEDEESSDTMSVLDSKGKEQYELQGEERIFSRSNSKVLIKMSKRAKKSKLDKDYKALGLKIFKYIDTHNTQKQDYVEIKE